MNQQLKRALVCAFLSFSAVCIAQSASDWPMYGHDGGSSRFSPLADINTQNVATLERAWTFHMAPTTLATPATGLSARLRQRRSETTPLMVDGVLYLPTPYNQVIALDASSGKNIWEYKIPNGANAGTRGVAYWSGNSSTSGRIVFGTSDGFLVALDAKTGKPAEQFGNDGKVDMKPGVANGSENIRFSLSSPPQVYKDVVITGAVVQESPSLGPSGDTRGWDPVTGKLLWQFHSVPRPGESGHESWETPDSWKGRSGTNVWGFISVDPETGLVFLPYGSPTTDAYGADRKGADLYGDCLVVLDATTGKLKWYFQPAPLGKMSFSTDEIAKVTPEHQKFCEDLLNYGGGMHNDGPFTRYGMKPSREAIGDMFKKDLLPTSSDGQCGMKLVPEHTVVVGETVNVVWRAEAPFFAEPYRGSEAFETRNGLLVLQVTTWDPSAIKMKK